MVQSGEMSLEEFVTKQAAWMSKQVARCAGLNLTISGPASPAGRGATPWKNKRKTAKRKPANGNKRSARPAGKA
jgi:DNA topoisomerase-3